MGGACAGLETFGVKLAEASKLFGKKFASGASITKSPMEKDQIEVRARRSLHHVMCNESSAL